MESGVLLYSRLKISIAQKRSKKIIPLLEHEQKLHILRRLAKPLMRFPACLSHMLPYSNILAFKIDQFRVNAICVQSRLALSVEETVRSTVCTMELSFILLLRMPSTCGALACHKQFLSLDSLTQAADHNYSFEEQFVSADLLDNPASHEESFLGGKVAGFHQLGSQYQGSTEIWPEDGPTHC